MKREMLCAQCNCERPHRLLEFGQKDDGGMWVYWIECEACEQQTPLEVPAELKEEEVKMPIFRRDQFGNGLARQTRKVDRS